MTHRQKITPCLWFDREALEAAELYASVFANARIDHVMRAQSDWPGGTAGDVIMVEFTLDGVAHQALNGGPSVTFNDAVSLSVICEDQAELDRIWSGLLQGGGEEVQCGWLKDRFGLRWQVVPRAYWRMIHEGSPAQVQGVMEAMFTMVKFDIAALEDAYRAAA